jgi:Cu/Ag efflux pump CusA
VPFGLPLVVRGSRERVRPIMTTAIVTALAFLPFLLFGDIPGQELLNPMALVVLGGLVTATLVSLFVVPILYLRFGSNAEPEMEFVPEPVLVS